mmetsp:Transcript_6905/g.13664  ORF Transcript_6905/g.13664 Transcript_6905/m.13664 type:complete len:295 (+) Transcript_6905:2-886(+)
MEHLNTPAGKASSRMKRTSGSRPGNRGGPTEAVDRVRGTVKGQVNEMRARNLAKTQRALRAVQISPPAFHNKAGSHRSSTQSASYPRPTNLTPRLNEEKERDRELARERRRRRLVPHLFSSSSDEEPFNCSRTTERSKEDNGRDVEVAAQRAVSIRAQWQRSPSARILSPYKDVSSARTPDLYRPTPEATPDLYQRTPTPLPTPTPMPTPMPSIPRSAARSPSSTFERERRRQRLRQTQALFDDEFEDKQNPARSTTGKRGQDHSSRIYRRGGTNTRQISEAFRRRVLKLQELE